ncbi:MAG: OsmC family protein [Planctomycetota bacterium]
MRGTFSVRVARGPDDGATALVRKDRVTVGAPLSFDEAYPRATAFELLLAAVGTDLVSGLAALARKARVPLDNIEAVVEGEIENPLAHLRVVGEAGHPGLKALAAKVYVRTPEEAEKVRRVWADLLRTSPMVHTFRFEPELILV